MLTLVKALPQVQYRKNSMKVWLTARGKQCPNWFVVLAGLGKQVAKALFGHRMAMNIKVCSLALPDH